MKRQSLADALYGYIEKPLSFQEAQIRQASLTVPGDLVALRAVLDKGHNITRSDARPRVDKHPLQTKLLWEDVA